MKKHPRGLTLILLLFCLFIPGCSKQSRYLSREARWREDIILMTQTLAKKHKNLFYHMPEEGFKAGTNALIEQIPDLRDGEILIEMMRLIAPVGDAHTGIRFNEAFFQTLTYTLPFTFRQFEDGVYVINTTQEYRNMLYNQVIKVEQHGIEAIYEHLSKLISHENEAQLRYLVPLMMVFPELLHGAGLITRPEELTITFSDPGGGQSVQKIGAVLIKSGRPEFLVDRQKDPDRPLYLHYGDKNYWFESLADHKLVYLAYNECQNMAGEPFRNFIKELFTTIDSQGMEKLVIDLRNNGGGDESVIAPLIKRLAEHSLNQANRLFIIIGRRTFSSAVTNAIQVKMKSAAIILGEPSGGKPTQRFGSMRTFDLPHSGLTISYATRWIRYPFADTPSLEPDIRIEESIDDYRQNRDPVLEYILKSDRLDPD